MSQTPVNKDAEVRDRYVGAAALKAALDDAGVAPARVGALYAGNMMSGTLAPAASSARCSPTTPAWRASRPSRSRPRAHRAPPPRAMGYLAIAAGAHEIVAVCGVERMTHVDHDTVTRARDGGGLGLEGAAGESFLSLNAQLMRAYMSRYGVRSEDFAPFSINAHRNALTNPNALLHKAITCDDYLASRVVADPVRLFDASPICNGAAALVLASAEGGRDAAPPTTHPSPAPRPPRRP